MKVAVVTGAAKGLGADIARFLAKNGYSVVAHFNKSSKEANLLLEEIKLDSPDSCVLGADLTKESEVSKLFNNINEKYGRLDLLVNNVGNFAYKPFNKTTNGESGRLIFSDYEDLSLSSELIIQKQLMAKLKDNTITFDETKQLLRLKFK